MLIQQKTRGIGSGKWKTDASHAVVGEHKHGYLLAFGGYLFTHNNACQQKIYWQCIESTCRALLHTNNVPMTLDANINVCNTHTSFL